MVGGDILVVGGVGELGFEVVKAAQAVSCALGPISGVIATYHRTQPTISERTATAGVTWAALDCSNHIAVRDLLANMGAICSIIYCAVPKHGGASGKGSEEIRAGIVDDVVSMATMAAKAGRRFVALSTDLVYDGRLPAGQRYSESDPPSPTNAYAHAKVEMEKKLLEIEASICIARTSLILTLGDVVGMETSSVRPGHGKGIRFVLEALEGTLPGKTGAVEMFTDELRCMSFSDDLAVALVHLAQPSCSFRGIVHLVSDEVANRYDLACRLAKFSGLENEIGRTVKAGLSAESGMDRPLNCSLRSDLLTVLLKGSGKRVRGLSERLPL